MKLRIRLVSEPTVESLAAESDDELIRQYHVEAHNMSFYNAAESPQWGRETEMRNKCKARFRLVCAEIAKRGLKPDNRGYLL